MELLSTHMFVSNYAFTGVIKTSFIREFHILKLKIDFHKILTNDRKLVDMVAKSCLEDITSPNALKLVSSEVIYSKVMDYYQSEAFRNYLEFINHRNFLEDQTNNQMWEIQFQFINDINHFKILLNTNEVLRLYNHINSFYSNYMTHDLAMKFAYNSEKLTASDVPKEEKKITEYVRNGITKVEEKKQEVEFKEQNDFDDIFALCLSAPIKSSLIHYTLNYFRYFDSTQSKLLVSNKGQVKIICPILMPGKFNIDESYFKSLILSSSLHINSVTYVIRKLLTTILQGHEKYKNKPVYIMMVGYLLFVYLMRYLYEVNKDNFRDHFSKIICNPESQRLLFTTLIKNTFIEFQNKIFFEFTSGDYIDNENNNKEEINKISSLYKHLLPISQEEFADKIFFDLGKKEKNKLPADFKISTKKVIDINNFLLEIDSLNNIHSKFFDSDNTLSPIEMDINDEYSFLNYKVIPSRNGEKIISEAYKSLINYTKNSSSLLLINKDNKIPKSVINLFDVISKHLLTTDKIKKDDVSTLHYYNLLVDLLPDISVFKHSTLLYIIYQIVIPYHYDLYTNTQFVDVFL